MSNGGDAVDRLRAAIEAHECFVAEHGRRSASEFLADHEQLRDLLEPLLARGRPRPSDGRAAGAADARVLGDFRLLGELGRGGMGVVYDAEQISLGRRVAVKILPSRLALDPDARARFEREARLAASLDHPGIAKVISADADDDVIWYAMERIDGAPLDLVLSRTADTDAASMTGERLESVVGEIADHHGLDGARCAPPAAEKSSHSVVWRLEYIATVVRIGAQIAAALDHAHRHGVVHRDVKPGNVLLRRDGSAVLTDFGLAREVAAPSLTLTGAFLGTPYYAAPEQLSGGRADHRADVFALGAMLYELLTHRRPFEASTSEEVRARILTVEPPQPRRFNRRISTDLSSVLLVALEKDPDRRYPTAAAMADDLRAVAEGRPVRARPTRAYARAWRWCRRSPRAATAVALLVATVVLLLGMRSQLVQANTELTLRTGVALARAKDFRSAFDELMPLEPRLPEAATRAALHELFRRFPCLAAHSLVSEPGEWVERAGFSPDGQWLYTVHERPTEPEATRRQVQLFAVPSPHAPLPKLLWKSEPGKGPLFVVHVDPGRTLAWSAGDRRVWVGGPARKTVSLQLAEPVQGLVTASIPGRFGVRLALGVELCDADGPAGRVWPPPPDSTFVLTILDDMLIRNGPTGHFHILSYSAPGPESKPVEMMRSTGLDFLDRIATEIDAGDPRRIVVTTKSCVTTWRTTAGEMEQCDRTKNPLHDWLPHYQFGVDLLKLANRKPGLARLGELPLHNPGSAVRVFGAADDRSSATYVVVVDDGMLRIWGMPEPQRLGPENGNPQELSPERRGLEIARFEPTGRRLWVGGENALLSSWSFGADGAGSHAEVIPAAIRDELLEQVEAPSYSGITFDNGRAMLACAHPRNPGSGRGRVVVVPIDRPERARAYACEFEPTWIALSPDHRRLAVARHDGGVELLSYDPDRQVLTDQRVTLPSLADDAIRLSCLCYLDLDGRFLLALEAKAKFRGGILRWDLRDPLSPPVQVAPQDVRQAQRCLVLSPDRKLVATGGDDKVVRLMRVHWRDGKPGLQPMWLREHSAPVYAVAFAERDGALILASADRIGGIRLWDARTGDDLGIVLDASNMPEPKDMILSLDFSPNGGRYLAAATHSGSVLLWDMDRPQHCVDGNRVAAARLLRLERKAR